ncbi:MAG: DNA topoisomerase IV subunit A [Kiritimatiellae bacterium]|nr:DNA topoisomerase IV subunit A [Kiritimatiellia bacterium]
MFDNLDLFALAGAGSAPDGAAADGGAAAAEAKPAKTKAAKTPPAPPKSEELGLTGAGPMKELFDFNFRQYSAYVICSRAIPAIEDGLKPVQRRIMHSLWEKDDGRYTKVANIVGHAMQYHPHGDASIGDAIVVLANKLWGEGRGYLIDGQGNYGSLYTGMPHAATRYIECRLTDLARKHLFNPKTTSFVPNYDGRREEPVFLPSKLPLLLMLGADGIAVGLSTSILPHNFIELLEAEIALIQKKPFELYPDFQLGGVMDVSEYDDGLGKIKIRARVEKDERKLVITELPWGETTDTISASIEDAIKKKKLAVRKLHDLTSEKVCIELELQAGASPEKTLVALYAFTNCEKSIASRPIVLDDGRPKLMKISEILRRNADRLMDLTRREQEIRLGELDDLFHARTLERIFIEERIYKLIEKEKTLEGVRNAIRDGFKPYMKQLRRKTISEEDVERLLKLQIRRISQFDIDKNREEIDAIKKEEAQVNDNIVHLRAFVVKYLKSLAKEYAKKYPRCTKIESGAFKQVDVRAITASELTLKWDKENNYIGSGLRNGEELFKCSSLDELILVWKDGRFRKVQPEEKIFVDKDLLTVLRYNQEKDRDTRDFVCVYEEGGYGFSYIKRFRFGGLIRNRDYRLAPEKPKSKLLFFQEGCPDTIYVKFKPAKNQRIHQQHFLPKEQVLRTNPSTGKAEKQDVVAIRNAGAKGKQLTTKPIARISSSKGSWWDESEPPSKGILD